MSATVRKTPDRRKVEAGDEADQDSADGQQHGVRDRRGPPRDQAQPGRGGAEKDEEEEKALRCAHRGVVDLLPTSLPGTPSRYGGFTAASEFYFLGGRILATQ